MRGKGRRTGSICAPPAPGSGASADLPPLQATSHPYQKVPLHSFGSCCARFAACLLAHLCAFEHGALERTPQLECSTAFCPTRPTRAVLVESSALKVFTSRPGVGPYARPGPAGEHMRPSGPGSGASADPPPLQATSHPYQKVPLHSVGSCCARFAACFISTRRAFPPPGIPRDTSL